MIIRKNDVKPFDFDGLKIADYTASLAGNSSFAVISVSPGISHQLSWSKRSDKYYHILSGKIHFFLNGKKYILSEGDLCIVRKGEKFKYANKSGEVIRMILIHTPDFHFDEEVFE